MKTLQQQQNQGFLKLSDAIQIPGIYTNSKCLNLNNRKIVEINQVDQKFRKIEQLNLKGNLIQSLGKIKQFTNLRFLDLSNNKISEQSELVKLKILQKLEAVNLSGNPFLKCRINQTSKAILENIKCDIFFKQETTEQLNQEESKLEGTLLENFLQLNFIQSLYKKLELHIEFSKVYYLEDSAHIDKKYIFNHHTEIQSLDEFIYSKYLQQLKLDAYTLKKTFNMEDLNVAYKNMIDRQNQKKRQLLILIDKKYEVRNNLRNLNIQSKQRIIINPSVNSHISNFSVKKKDILSSNNHKSPDFQQKSPSKSIILKLNQKSRTSKQNSIFQIFKKSKSPPSRKQQEKYQARYYKNLTRKNPVYHLLYSPLHTLKNKEKDLLIETLSNNLKQKTIELYRREDYMKKYQQQYKNHILSLNQEIAELKHQTEILNNKLLISEENIINDKQQSIDRLKLEKELERIQFQMKQIKMNQNKLKKMTEQKQQYINNLVIEQKKSDQIQGMQQKRLKHKYLHLMYNKFLKYRKLNKLRQINSQKTNKIYKENAFYHLMENLKTQRKIQFANQKKQSKLIKFYFDTVIEFSRTCIKAKALKNSKRKFSLILAINHFQFSVMKKKIQRLHKNKSLNHLKFNRYNKVWKILKLEWIKFNSKEAKQMQNEIDCHSNKKLLFKVFQNWIELFQNKKQQNLQLSTQVNQLQKKIILRDWKSKYYAQRQENFVKKIIEKRQTTILKQYLSIWNNRTKQNQLENLKLETQLKTTKKFDNFMTLKKKLKKIQSNKSRFRTLIYRINFKKIIESIQIKLKQFYLELKKYSIHTKNCFYELKFNKQSEINKKSKILLNHLKTKRLYQFYYFFKLRKSMKKIYNNKIQNNKILMMKKNTLKIFNVWKCITLQQKNSILTNKVEVLNSIVSEFHQKQQRFNNEYEIIIEDLKLRNQEFNNYELKIKDLNFQLLNKDIKYQKLQNVYEATINQMRLRENQFLQIINNIQYRYKQPNRISHQYYQTINQSKRLKTESYSTNRVQVPKFQNHKTLKFYNKKQL